MVAGHSHGATTPSGTAAGRHKTRLMGALALTTIFMAVEVVGGLWTGSLALLADAAHMLTDAGALALSYLAFRFGRRAADQRRSFGYLRLEVVAAFVNALTLFAIVLWIAYEAWHRLTLISSAPISTAEAGVTVFLRGKFWDKFSGGHGFISHNGQTSPDQPGTSARLLNLWL